MNEGIYPINKYDVIHDTFHIYLNNRCNEYDSSAEEQATDIYVLKDDVTDEIVGFKIFDFTKNVDKFQKLYPQISVTVPNGKTNRRTA